MTSSSSLEILERDQAGQLVATYILSPDGISKAKSRIDISVPENTNSYLKTVLNAFLPAGYPHSVTEDYLEYQIYDSLQAFSSSIAGLLASRAVLEGVGVGDATASPTAALLLSVLQDSTGRVATILFAHRLGSALEPECKMYRLAADVFNDAAMLLDCLSPALPRVWRVLLLSGSSVLRALCGVAAGSAKASLSAHFATQGNLGELNAKDSSQETVISLIGMLAGSFVVSRISSPSATWTAMILLLGLHLGTNYLAVRAVSMTTLNRQRANIVISHYLSQTQQDQQQRHQDRNSSSSSPSSAPFPEETTTTTTTATTAKTLALTPQQVSARERIFERDGVLRWNGDNAPFRCELGVPLARILALVHRAAPTHAASSSSSSSSTISSTGFPPPATAATSAAAAAKSATPAPEKQKENKEVEKGEDDDDDNDKDDDNDEWVEDDRLLRRLFRHERHVLWYEPARRTFLVGLERGADAEAALRAWAHALCAARALAGLPSSSSSSLSLSRPPVLPAVVERSLAEVDARWAGMRAALRAAGWELGGRNGPAGALETGPARRRFEVRKRE